MSAMRKAFTLMEVNLAIFIMAMGVLAMVSLYGLGMRESRQSTEDVATASYADAVLAPLVAKLSSQNMTWAGWTSVGSAPDGEGSSICDGVSQSGRGWAAYVQKVGSDQDGRFRIVSGCTDLAKQAFNEIANAAEDTTVAATATGNPGANRSPSGDSKIAISWPDVPNNYYYGLVATRRGSTISLAFRASKRRDGLMSQPVYYTEVQFQGRTDK